MRGRRGRREGTGTRCGREARPASQPSGTASRRPWNLPLGKGFSLPELLLALAILAILAGIAVPGGARLAGRHALGRAASLARTHLVRARVLAVAGRRTVRVRLDPGGSLVALDARGRIVAATPLRDAGLLGVDSVRLRPATLRFNARGQAGPGSLYLYRGGRGVRLVVNFIGRVRREDFTYGSP